MKFSSLLSKSADVSDDADVFLNFVGDSISLNLVKRLLSSISQFEAFATRVVCDIINDANSHCLEDRLTEQSFCTLIFENKFSNGSYMAGSFDVRQKKEWTLSILDVL